MTLAALLCFSRLCGGFRGGGFGHTGDDGAGSWEFAESFCGSLACGLVFELGGHGCVVLRRHRRRSENQRNEKHEFHGFLQWLAAILFCAATSSNDNLRRSLS